MDDDIMAHVVNNWPYPADSFTKRAAVSDNTSPVNKEYLEQLAKRMSNTMVSPAPDWRARREHVAKFKETYVKLRSENIALSHHAAIELAKLIYKESETITWEDTQ